MNACLYMWVTGRDMIDVTPLMPAKSNAVLAGCRARLSIQVCARRFAGISTIRDGGTGSAQAFTGASGSEFQHERANPRFWS